MRKEPFKDFFKRVYGLEYGKGEIKVFTPQIKKALRIIATESTRDSKVRTKIRKLGFKVCKSSGVAFVGNEQVIKQCFVYDKNLPTPDKDVRVPTLILETNGYSTLMIQPKADIPSMRERQDMVREIRPKVRIGYDVHVWNVGRYKKKNVLFDW
jgi:hypothetical protein